jgi:hypothetical protein
MLPRWFQFVALFMTMFVLLDVCTPEPCEAQTATTAQSTAQFQLQHSGAGDNCQFEEDCFACAHYAPGCMFFLQPSEAVMNALPATYISTLAGTPVLPYHPPRF